MSKRINMIPLKDKKIKLQEILERLEELKGSLVDMIDEYEAEDGDSDKIDTLTEALDGLEEAYDAVNDVVMDEQE